MRSILFPLALVLAGCALPPPEQAAYPGRMARFAGLVARCECSDISVGRMLAEYPKAVAGRYSPAEVAAMRGYVDLALGENFDNQLEICGEVCAQDCMVNAVVLPLGGLPRGDGTACPVSERDLHLTQGRQDGDFQ